MDNEIWKDVVGYEGKYQISNMGRVKSLKYRQKECSQIIKPICNLDGYYFVNLYKDGINKKQRIHRMVAEAFIPNLENKSEVDHINTIRTDNRAENLRWVTRKENCNNKLTKEKRIKCMIGKNIGNQGKKVKCLNTNEVFVSAGDAARRLGLHRTNVSRCCNGEFKQVKGYRFEYYKEE